eukprot:g12449.t1
MTRRLACLAVLGGPALVAGAQAVEAVPAEPVAEVEDNAEEQAVDLIGYAPGFRPLLAEEELQKQIAKLSDHIKQADWALAFRMLTELGDDQLEVMVPIGEAGQHVLVKEQLQRQLLSLTPDGQRAFRLYFDGQANELFDKVKNHPLPGSEDQLKQAQVLVDRLLASSIGGEAARLLGDMYFERGMFDQADRCWRLSLEYGSATGKEALTLQAKRTLAMQRAGNLSQAQALYNSLKDRYEQATIHAGGEEVDAIALLGNYFQQLTPREQAGAPAKLAGGLLPSRDAKPAWHLRFMSPASRNTTLGLSSQRSFYSPPSDLGKFIPPVVADDQRVYFQWLGVVFALDRQTGKLLWQSGEIKKVVQTVVTRSQTNQGDPRNYRIALSEGLVLVTQPLSEDNRSPFVLKAYDKASGAIKWTSDAREDWSLGIGEKPQAAKTALLGQVLVHEGRAYAVVAQAGQNTLSLRRFDPASGRVDWTIPLGSAEVIAFQYTNVSRMPQPTLLMGPSLLYVLTNNGAMIAVDVIAGEAKWALKMDPPVGIGLQNGPQSFFRGNGLSDRLNAMANSNGSGRLLLHDNVLYAKEHNSETLYALEPDSGQVQWKADYLKPDARLIGITKNRFYVMNRGLQCYQLDGERDLITQNSQNTGKPDHAGALLLEDKILLYGVGFSDGEIKGILRGLDLEQLDPAGKYESAEYLGTKGGHLYALDDLLIAIDDAQITAFMIEKQLNNEPNLSETTP